ncbi:hypothetical protein AAFF_G00303830 [Aldrovandia affinis]|uniref:Uncharacterized protein n=1 Tax=Aldrovandia affinis TaxID=143900 RepID=A0AAD7WR38_9TELE|nr:hypothetical protein AAFF_G00303830 [Aldrovandia affinis]
MLLTDRRSNGVFPPVTLLFRLVSNALHSWPSGRSLFVGLLADFFSPDGAQELDSSTATASSVHHRKDEGESPTLSGTGRFWVGSGQSGDDDDDDDDYAFQLYSAFSNLKALCSEGGALTSATTNVQHPQPQQPFCTRTLTRPQQSGRMDPLKGGGLTGFVTSLRVLNSSTMTACWLIKESLNSVPIWRPALCARR